MTRRGVTQVDNRRVLHTDPDTVANSNGFVDHLIRREGDQTLETEKQQKSHDTVYT